MPEIGESVVYIGIDPGASGGLVALIGKTVCHAKMPETERDIWDWISGKSEPFGYRSVAVIEWIHPAIQGIGKSPMSKLYGNYKMLRGMLTAARIPYEDVKPAKWQQAVGITKVKDEERVKWKNRLKDKAQQIFPHVGVTLAIADALLIAEFCRRKHRGTL